MEESKLATAVNPKVGAPPTATWTWKSIDWKSAKETVRRLQERIAKATQLGKFNKVKILQRLLTKSFSAMVLAVKRVTANKGKNTPGVDKVIWKTPNQKKLAVEDLMKRDLYKASPLRRIHIPKKNGKLRPLGIPTMKDRAVQAIHLLALDPVAETLADKNSYGFRPKRSLHDAVAACFNALAKKSSPQWILEGDIKACFDAEDSAVKTLAGPLPQHPKRSAIERYGGVGKTVEEMLDSAGTVETRKKSLFSPCQFTLEKIDCPDIRTMPVSHVW